jgi:hypothetical protein
MLKIGEKTKMKHTAATAKHAKTPPNILVVF